jgi:DNA-binding NtrC family response regulator
MNGIEMAISIRREFATCRILLFSGQAATADMLEEARGHGHEFEILAKPVHPEQLIETVKHLIGSADEFVDSRARAK